MRPDESLQEHVRRQASSADCPGPHVEVGATTHEFRKNNSSTEMHDIVMHFLRRVCLKASLMYICKAGMNARGAKTLQDAQRVSARSWSTVATFRGEWQVNELEIARPDIHPTDVLSPTCCRRS